MVLGKPLQSQNFRRKTVRPQIFELFTAVLLSAFSVGAASVPASQIMSGLPLFFEYRQQGPETSSQFLARGINYQFLIEPTGVQFVLCRRGTKSAAHPFSREMPDLSWSVLTRSVRMEFLDANPQARAYGMDETSGKVNYLLGSDRARWRSQVPTYAKVRVPELYPGIALVYYGNQHQLEYDITFSSGADPNLLAMRFEGVDQLAINERGELALSIGEGEIRQHRPVLYQIVNGVHRIVSGGYRLIDKQTVGFYVGNYERRLPLIIDPTLSYSTFFGGNGGDTGLAIKVDADASVYIAGQTLSAQFAFGVPTNAFQREFAGGTVNGDAFVAKLDNTGSRLIYFTYLGGSADDTALDLAVDTRGNAYITGFTDSSDFPTKNPLFGNISGIEDPALHIYPLDAFVAELNTNGSALVYSTFLGGSANDVGSAITVDPAGNTYVTGYAYSTDFPLKNAVQTAQQGNEDVFVAKIGPGGRPLVYSTYLGGAGRDQGEGIAADAAGFAYVTGYTTSTGFPVTANAQNKTINGSAGTPAIFDAFVTRIAQNGFNLIYSTYLGGTNNDFGYRIAVDSAQNAYVTGAAQSPDFPQTTSVPGLPGGNLGTNALNYDAFLTRLNASGIRTYSVLFGGTQDDQGWDVAFDAAGRVFVTGTTVSTNFPVVNASGLLRDFNSGSKDAFVTALNTNGTAVEYSAYLGGKSDEYGYGIAVDAEGNAYITGLTFSGNFPVISPAFQPSLRGPSSAFVTKIRLFDPQLSVHSQPGALVFSWPISAPDYSLQSASNIASGPDWTDISQTPTLINRAYTIALSTTNAAGFFRLVRR